MEVYKEENDMISGIWSREGNSSSMESGWKYIGGGRRPAEA